MKRLWPVILVMFMLCLWAAAPVANATPTDIETPSITNIVLVDVGVVIPMVYPKGERIAPIDSVASVDVSAVIGTYGNLYANFIDNSKTTAPKPMITTILAEALTKTPAHYLTL